MRTKSILAVSLVVLFVVTTQTFSAPTILFEDFEDSSGLTISGNASYWGIAPLSGVPAVGPSYFVQGGSQSGNIFLGINGWDSTARMTISLPDLTRYTDLQLTVALAATEGDRWENTHRDSLIISGTTGVIDSFLPLGYSSPLTSQVYYTDLRWDFQDFQYSIDSSLTSLTFAFASTAGVEVVGIDSVRITGTPAVIPAPSAILLGSIGVGFVTWLRRRRTL